MNIPATAAPATDASLDASIDAVIDAAVERIAPTWPLDRMIAVNPYWGYISQPFDEVANVMATIAGSPFTQEISLYRKAWEAGEISLAALERARHEAQCVLTTGQLVEALEMDSPQPLPAPLLADILDRQRDLLHQPAWCDTITHQVSQFCAAYFDRDQSDWRPEQSRELYASWRSGLARDHSVALLMKAPGIPAKAAGLAEHPRQQIAGALALLGVPAEDVPDYLQAVLARVSGWAAWCAYLRWQARLTGGDDHTIVDLLAIRLSWECLVDDGKRENGSVWGCWQSAWLEHFQAAENISPQPHTVWQRAQEISYQDTLIAKLSAASASDGPATPEVQAVFCIDVRSEVFRRHLEAQSSEIQTLGFAGFFGLPISYTPLGTDARRPQLPGLLAPTLHTTDSAGDATRDANIAGQRDANLRATRSWRTFQSLPLSAFILVESLGLGYLAKLVQRTLPGKGGQTSDDSLGLTDSHGSALRPVLDSHAAGGLEGQLAVAVAVLTAMGLTDNFARLVLLVGHGSQTRNNPQRAGLDCGACCGQRGEVNARVLAGLLNDPDVRDQLRKAGIDIPHSTAFVAALHNTTTDDVELYDVDAIADSHGAELTALGEHLAGAQREAAWERAASLGLQTLRNRPEALTQALRERANDWSQTRPEWGLANNAALIVAPRSATRGVDLEGRCFLHDYDCRRDPEGTLLEQIMTAPMVVAHWINMQYYASTVDNRRYGSGNKTLHNVVGGRLGVFEGNGGDLRIGLSLQSLHDGQRWQHTPLRLTVVIQAPRDAIDAVIEKHETVRHLVTNRWLYLVRIEGNRAETYRPGGWEPWRGE